MKDKEESKNTDLKLTIIKTKITTSDSITLWQIVEKKVEVVAYFILQGSKITAVVTAAMKLKTACSWKGKL